jgi:3-methyladenine DNA glycosylase AlkD
MTLKEVLAKLESLGNESRRKHNAKAGAGDNQFGVKSGDIRALAKKIKTGHELALKLWDTGNADAQLLAALIMNPKALTAAEVETLTRTTAFAYAADWFNSSIVANHPDKESLRQKWMKLSAAKANKDPWSARAGWHFTASLINSKAATPALDLPALLDRIETDMPKARPEIQWTMNNTLGAIGIHHPKLRQRAIAIGESIGLYKDWPVSKGCIIPYVPVWVEAMVKRGS